MKKNLHDFFYNTEALILLAEYLHNVLSSRQRKEARMTSNIKANIDKRFEETLKRLRKSIDHKAKSAHSLLRCKITSMTSPDRVDTVYIGISPSRKKTKVV